jgi:ubiquinone/menaquinone biosynthesis C-methylase UbiE
MQKELTAQGWTQDSRDYNKWVVKGLESPRYRRAWAAVLQRGLATTKRLDILDVGTGPGVMAFLLAQQGHRLTGLDLSEGMIEQARMNAATLDLPVSFRVGDAEALPFPDASFNAVVNRIVLWNLPNPKTALREWVRVLKPGGRLVVVDMVDGLRRYGTLKHKLQLYASVPFVLLDEKRNPLNAHRDRSEWHKLPLYHQARPQWEENQFEQLGLTNIESFLIPRSHFGLMEYLKYCCWGDYFAVCGTKP